MSESNRNGDAIYAVNGEPMMTACRSPLGATRPPCAYCEKTSTRACDAPAAIRRQGRWGRCWRPMCEAHTARVGERQDLCREHAIGDQVATLKAGDTAHWVWWEIVETKTVPIPGTERALEASDRIPGILDPEDEQRANG